MRQQEAECAANHAEIILPQQEEIMNAFRCIAIQTETADRFRSTGRDDNGNTLRSMPATELGSFPCRHCLSFALPGETMLLGSYNLPRPTGIYWTPSPIFVHAEACSRFSAENTVAPIIAQGVLVSVRAYDQADQCVYDLGQVCAGVEVNAPLERALSDPRTAFVNVHTARPGCLLSRVERQ
jgi:hypothetical protein